MKQLVNKAKKARTNLDAVREDLFFQALPEDNKRDLYNAIDALKTFQDNLPTKK